MDALAIRSVAACAFLVLTTQLHADVIAANNIPDDWAPSSFRGDIGYSSPPQFPNTAEAQYFLSGETGLVTSITSSIRHGFAGGGTAPLRIAIHNANGPLGSSLPGSLIGFLEFSPDLFPGFAAFDQLVTLDFTAAGVTIEAGHAYHVVLTTDVPVLNGAQYSTSWQTPSPLNFGQGPNFSANHGTDWRPPLSFPNELPLRIEVVPAPGACTLLCAIGFISTRRRR